MIRVPALSAGLTAVRVHRDEAVLCSAGAQVAVCGAWCGDALALVDGQRTSAEIAAAAGCVSVLDTLLRLEERGLLIEQADALLLRQADAANGIVRNLVRRETAGDFLHVVCAAQTMPAASEARMGDDLRMAVGTGLSQREAVTSCIGEAVERYCASFDGTEAMVRRRREDLDAPSIAASELLLISDQQYAGRAEWNRLLGAELWLPERPDDNAVLNWTPVWNLRRQEKWYVPTAFCYLRCPSERPECFGGDSNGCAAGPTLAEAMERGFCELVERDAIALWWYNRAARPGLPLVESGGRPAELLYNKLAAVGRSVHLLDLTTDLGIPVVAAISARRDGSHVAFGFGASFERPRAARRALLEMQQVLGAIESGECRGLLERWCNEANLERDGWLAPAPGRAPGASEGADPKASLEILVADCTRPAIGVPVVRVIVPGLRPAAPRFAPGRLYDKLREEELNPFPFFL